MRIIDKTPFVEEDGSISIVNRIKGTLQNGFSWYGNLEAQQRALAYFDKQFDKKFTIIRNHTLGASKLTIPFILIGTPGIYVFIVTNLEGTYRAKGANWGKIEGEKYKEASINLVKRTIQYTKAVERYLEKQGVPLPEEATPILLALNSGMHIETVRPAVRIVMSDALDRFAAEIRQTPPIMTKEDVYMVAEALLEPIRKKSATPASTAASLSEPAAADLPGVAAYDPYAEAGDASQAESFGDLGFSFDDAEETPANETLPPVPIMEEAAPRPKPAPKRRKPAAKRGLLGMTTKQLIIIAAMAGFIALMLVVVIIVALMSL